MGIPVAAEDRPKSARIAIAPRGPGEFRAKSRREAWPEIADQGGIPLRVEGAEVPNRSRPAHIVTVACQLLFNNETIVAARSALVITQNFCPLLAS